jgi:hypothetical protein
LWSVSGYVRRISFTMILLTKFSSVAIAEVRRGQLHLLIPW